MYSKAFLALCVVMAPGIIHAQDPPTKDLTLEDCALLKDGVRRLACYDALVEPQATREQASQREQEAAEEATRTLGVDDPDGEPETEATTDDGSVMRSIVDRAAATERALFSFSGSFVPHRPTYILPATWVHNPNQTPFSPTLGESGAPGRLKNEEAKFQISFKVPLLTGLLDDRTTLWFGYTQLSFWQITNTDNSKPFRETNYEPELFLRHQTNFDIGPGRVDFLSLGINHQSNGRSEPESRSWNRIQGNITYSYDRWLFMVSPWYRIPETSNNDNPDLEHFIGHADYWAVYKWSDDKTLSLKLRNNLESSDNKTSVQLGYSFPMGGTVKGYIEYYNGYGESLIDYNHRINRISFGLMLNNWL